MLYWFLLEHVRDTRFVIHIVSPIHIKHVELMNAAKQYMEVFLNYQILGGYLSPAHDSYNKVCSILQFLTF